MIDLHPALLTFVRSAPDGESQVICIHNVSGNETPVTIDLKALGLTSGRSVIDLIGGESYDLDKQGRFSGVIGAYTVLWLRIG